MDLEALTSEAIPITHKDHVCKTSMKQVILPLLTKENVVMFDGECSVYGCNCPKYVGSEVGTCGNCGHHYDSHRY